MAYPLGKVQLRAGGRGKGKRGEEEPAAVLLVLPVAQVESLLRLLFARADDDCLLHVVVRIRDGHHMTVVHIVADCGGAAAAGCPWRRMENDRGCRMRRRPRRSGWFGVE